MSNYKRFSFLTIPEKSANFVYEDFLSFYWK
jgi:hypothetical protein